MCNAFLGLYNTIGSDPQRWGVEQLEMICLGHRVALGVECWNKWAQSLDEDSSEINFSTEDIKFSVSLDAHKVNFCGFLFPVPTSFDQVNFGHNVDFSECHFSNKVSFNHTQFSKPVEFKNTVFESNTFFEHTKFNSVSTFVFTQFHGETFFSNTHFDQETRFEGCEFHEYIKFEETRFQSATIFDGYDECKKTVFKKLAEFSSCTFSRFAKFSHCTFEDVSIFANCTFEMNCSFQSATFNADFNFQYNTINGTSNFLSINLSGITSIIFNTFEQRVSFKPEAISGPINFDSSIFNGHAEFSETYFSEFVDFKGAVFNNVFNLFGSTFAVVPNFSFTQIKVPVDPAQFTIDNSRPEGNDSIKWRRLKVLANDAHNHEMELEFFRNELESLANEPDASWSRKKLTTLYKLTSNYGASVTRPSIGIAGLTTVFFIFYLFGVSNTSWDINIFGTALRTFFYSVTASIPTLTVFSETAQENSKYLFSEGRSLWIGILSMIQTFISSILIFLLLLAIRNRFRL